MLSVLFAVSLFIGAMFIRSMHANKYRLYCIALCAIFDYNYYKWSVEKIPRALKPTEVLYPYEYVISHSLFDWGMLAMLKQKHYYDMLEPYFKPFNQKRVEEIMRILGGIN